MRVYGCQVGRGSPKSFVLLENFRAEFELGLSLISGLLEFGFDFNLCLILGLFSFWDELKKL